MQKIPSDTNINFTIGDTTFQTLNMICEEFHRTIPSHVHGSGNYEIHYICSGYGRALINGEHYQITPNTLFVTGPHVEHAQAPLAEDPMCEYCVYLKTEKKRRPASPDVHSDTLTVLSSFENTPFWFGQDTQNAGAALMELFQEASEQKKGWQIQAEALLKQLLVCLIRNYEKDSRTSLIPKPRFTDRTSIIIEDYFLYQYQNLSLEELAGKLGLGTRQTERLLQKQYGKTFLQKKTEAKMSAASTLLTDTAQSITSIAEALGYSSIEHFSSAFKKYYHCSPRQYRKRG